MFESLPLAALLAIFLVAAGVVWGAGIKLTDTTDVLSTRLHLGQALGAMLFLAFATNLPEVAIAVAGGVSGHPEIVTGNILGGIAIQTLVLVLLDVVAGEKSGRPLTYTAASLVLAVEGLLVIALLAAVVMASQLPSSISLLRIHPGSLVIVVLWLIGLWMVRRARTQLPWQDDRDDVASVQDRSEDEQSVRMSLRRAVLLFAGAATVTLLGGVALEQSSEAIAKQLGMSNIVFGATALAAATALPEVSTGIASVRLGDSRLAISDILGGNAFLPSLFFLTSFVSGSPVLPGARPPDLYLTGLALLLSAIVVVGLIFRPRRQILRMGTDSLAILVLYVIGIIGLLFVPSG
jgi:cation:H+ antiporter